jgi:hypothetical protein
VLAYGACSSTSSAPREASIRKSRDGSPAFTVGVNGRQAASSSPTKPWTTLILSTM